MKTIKIYKITITKAYMMSEQGEGFSLTPWNGNNIDYEGYDDGGKEYFLPEGYEIAMSNSETLEIYNSAGQHCPLVKKFNSPCIIDDDEIMLSQIGN